MRPHNKAKYKISAQKILNLKTLMDKYRNKQALLTDKHVVADQYCLCFFQHFSLIYFCCFCLQIIKKYIYYLSFLEITRFLQD